ncbi:abnormal spindle-like microcephaly-associated protein homolog [Belonocnema kinseyi]|uniref:abnormal spindle-like microcephaly-associated protein homolog n=1 Tax=Belonocnema kinseyi TaxID=2817044 RepID=UPI00143D0FF4|nr:abnormal spindle-like microcephaly-associated protein homolog [Belonocnema kinseyi]
MFLQINISPKDERISESPGQHLKLKEDIFRVLKPFELPSRISMQTFVNTKTEYVLQIRNTNDCALNVNITKRPPQERFVELSFTSAFVEANSSVSLKITWSPKKSGQIREILQLTDNFQRFYEILLLMDAKVPPKNIKNSQITPSRNFRVSQNESSLNKKSLKPRNKRTRIDFDQVDPKKEIFTHLKYDPFTEKAIKKSRKEFFIFEETLKRETKEKVASNFSLPISNINLTPKNATDEVFQFSHRGISAWSESKKRLSNRANFASSTPARKVISSLKPSKFVQNFEILKPPAPEKESVENMKIPALKSKELSINSLKKKSLTRKKANQSLKTDKKSNLELDDRSDFMINFVNPDPFATTEDPFLSCTLNYDEKWVFLQEVAFKKWLNTLMTAPEHLSIDMESTAVDVSKVWQSCRLKEEVLAESKESISARYHTNTRLNTLRKAAFVMFRKDEVKEAIASAQHCIENGSLVFKKDKDPCRDIGLQKEILELFLSYNPLWLRIGLETVYGETIPLQSNNDLIGLTRFLLARFFSDPVILKKHSYPTIAVKLPNFTFQMNNFMLKMFLQLVYFLDYAKMNKLIGHDPCLFRKKAQHKESRSILLTFSREVLSGIGDITKVLRLAGYVVHYKQNYLDEFDYAVNDMSLDLRDGVRLCRTMELIRGKGNLTSYCRVPAVSKLQKIHNVNIALTALLDSGYFLIGQIDAKSIVNGDREKTLSLLWQIIFKFQAPRFEKAATSLQTWWRSKLWYIQVRNFLKKRKSNAASVIQRSWRCYLAKRELNQLRDENRKSAIPRIQRLNASRVIQKWWRRIWILKRERNHFLLMKHAVWVLEKNWIKRKMIKEEMRKKSCRKIENWWRGLKEAKTIQARFSRMRNAALIIQKNWRMLQARRNYLLIKFAVLKIEFWYLGLLVSRSAREQFLRKKNSVRIIENWWGKFLERKSAERKSSIVIQKYWRCYEARKIFKIKREAAIRIQDWWREILRKKQLEVEKILEFRRTETLRTILQKSINSFLFSNDLGRLSMCLASLDFITRLSANGCITVCKVGLVDKIFMTLVQSNRSVPWMDVCTRASSILITLAKYPPTRPFILEKKYIETLARFLTVTVEKEIQLFLHLATLMWILIEDSKYAEALLRNSRSAWLLKSLYDTVSKKMHKFATANSETMEVLPNPKPDWGLKQKQPRIFGNVVHAVTSISERLSEY